MNYSPKKATGLLTRPSFHSVETYSASESTTIFSTPTSTITVARVPWSELHSSAYLRKLNGPAVYGIVSVCADRSAEVSVYVGSSGCVCRRLLSHKGDERHTNAQAIFVCTSASLDVTSTHYRRAEGILCRATAQQPDVTVSSADVPSFPMSPRDEAVMSGLVPPMFELLAAAGYPLNNRTELVLDGVDFLPSYASPSEQKTRSRGNVLDGLDSDLWIFEDDGGCLSSYNLVGTTTEAGTFVLFPGSEFRVDGGLKPTDTVRRAREAMYENGVLGETGEPDGRHVLRFPVEVSSAKTAVAVMLQANRKTAHYWKRHPLSVAPNETQVGTPVETEGAHALSPPASSANLNPSPATTTA